MIAIDIFNGDADGLCALVQLRRAKPADATLITGVKRDIQLLKRIDSERAHNASLTVLDISYEKNAADVARLLQYGARIDYFDHHKTGKIAKHDSLKLNVNLNADVCTALIVDNYLGGQYKAWAIVGAYGDNLLAVADALAAVSGYTPAQIELMRNLGYMLNYNAYGDTVADLHYDPAKLFMLMREHDTPFSFVSDNGEVCQALSDGYQADFTKAKAIKPIVETKSTAVYELPNISWSRRISGMFGNHLANANPDKAHAVIRQNAEGCYVVSIRAPISDKRGAEEVASHFVTGGGRKAAAGITALPKAELSKFIAIFNTFYQ